MTPNPTTKRCRQIMLHYVIIMVRLTITAEGREALLLAMQVCVLTVQHCL